MAQQLQDTTTGEHFPFFLIATSEHGNIKWVEGAPLGLLPNNHTIVGQNIRDFLASDIEPDVFDSIFDSEVQSPQSFIFNKHDYGEQQPSIYQVWVSKSTQSNAAEVPTLLFWVSAEINPINELNYFQALTDHFPFLFWCKDTESRFLHINKHFASVTKYKKIENILNKTDFDCFDENLAKEYVADDKRVMASKKAKFVTEKFVDVNNKESWIDTWKAPVIKNGQVVGTIGIATDVSDKVEAHRKLEESHQFIADVIDAIAEPVFVINRQHEFILVNQAFSDASAISKQALMGKTAYDIAPKHQADVFHEKDELVFNTGEENVNLEKFTDKDGNVKTSLTKKTRLNETCLVGLIQDITEITQLNEQLKKSEELFRTLAENSPDVIVRFNKQLEYVYINSTLADLLPDPVELVIGTALPDEFTELKQGLKKVIETQKMQVIDRWDHEVGGHRVIHNIILIPEFDDHKQFTSVLVIGRDVTEYCQLQDDLIKEEQSFKHLAESMPDIIIRYDLQLRRTYINKGYSKQLSLSDEKSSSIIGARPSENWVATDDINDAYYYEQQLQKALDTNSQVIWHQFFVLSEGGKLKEYECRAVPEIIDDANQPTGVLLFARDVSQQREFEKQLQFLANHDPLTGLNNRRSFSIKVRDYLNSDNEFAVVFLDLDNFKPINDKCGHDVGDTVLKVIAERLVSIISGPHEIGRLGGDEFGLLINRAVEPNLEGLIKNVLESLAKPIQLEQMKAYLTGSIGIALYPEMDVESEDELLRYADQAMYLAKAEGRNCYRYFDIENHDTHTKFQQQVKELAYALNHDQIEVYYQPIVDSKTGKVMKAEALVRWLHPEKGLISPLDFIDVAEKSGLIIQLGDLVFKEAAQFSKRFHQILLSENTPPDFRVSINISSVQLSQENMVNSWLDYLSLHDIPGNHITIELTESLLIEDDPLIVAQLALLQMHGLTISLDDFGTGYSALSYLKKFSMDYLKIDRSFIRDIIEDESDRAIVEAIILMARRLSIIVVAEGVEDEEQLQLLTKVGCDLIQGYYFSKPLPDSGFIEWFHKYSERSTVY